MPLPLDPWHAWYEGQPDTAGQAGCAVITKYMYWVIRKVVLDDYRWRNYPCDFNVVKEIQGFICEREFDWKSGCLLCKPYAVKSRDSCAGVTLWKPASCVGVCACFVGVAVGEWGLGVRVQTSFAKWKDNIL